MSTGYTKWAACWGNATSIREQTECIYAKDLTLRYPLFMCFSGDRLRFHFSNLTGSEPVTLQACVSGPSADEKFGMETADITYRGEKKIHILPGSETVSDEIPFTVRAGEALNVSIYLDGYTQMNAGVLITGPLSKGFYSYGNHMYDEDLPLDLSRQTSWFQFLNTVDIHTEEKNHALICYGDSITAQSWPDYLSLRAWENGYRNIAVIRRAVSGTRILRQYDNITYAAYGLKGKTRFPVEMNTAGADTVLIQHGINDIIHPVGVDVNPFRPWRDLPTGKELRDGYKELYIDYARSLGMKVWGGTLLPIKGWRTYEPFREDLKNEFNQWLRTTDLLDGCVDFDLTLRDPEYPESFRKEYDSGDHLHPSEAGYKAMANAIPEILLK